MLELQNTHNPSTSDILLGEVEFNSRANEVFSLNSKGEKIRFYSRFEQSFQNNLHINVYITKESLEWSLIVQFVHRRSQLHRRLSDHYPKTARDSVISIDKMRLSPLHRWSFDFSTSCWNLLCCRPHQGRQSNWQAFACASMATIWFYRRLDFHSFRLYGRSQMLGLKLKWKLENVQLVNGQWSSPEVGFTAHNDLYCSLSLCWHHW